MSDRDRGIRSGGAFSWFFQRISGVFLLLALLVHFWVLHFSAPDHGEITFGSVMERLNNPLWRAFDILFVVTAVYHAMNGALLIVQDYIRATGLRMIVVAGLWIGALYFLIVGSMTILGLA
ncbi:MAG TPA: succinate dehydrogenase, hydrophobic membrane anchor protein [Bacteroidetes bacterium]|nr:succinate dehydrogenase, hydrophobic membrane anchor protein [Bacteroidota bacterium]